MKEAKLTVALVGEFLSYDENTGLFTWLKRPAQCVAAGSIAGHLRPDGYMQVRFKGSTFLSHRLAFFVQTGEWPPHDLDHVNGDRADNRWRNLRPATRSQNRMNSRGVLGRDLPKGVTRSQRGRPYTAGIAINGVMTHIGCFDTAEQASEAYADAARKHFGEFARAA